MKKYLSIIAIVATILSMTSCASYQKTAPVMGISGNNINTYVAADLDLAGAKKVSATVKQKILFFFIPLVHNGNKTIMSSNRYGHLSHSQAQALYRAKESSDVDIILEPQFSTEHHSWFFGLYQTTKTEVTGWGVNINGLKEDKNVNIMPNIQSSHSVAPLF